MTRRETAQQAEESPRITLPTDPDRVNFLQRKLDQYKGRISSYNEEHPNQHPAYREMVLADAICKTTIVERLLKDGEVSAWDLSKELIDGQKKNGEANQQAFAGKWNNAWAVVQDYCLTGGANVMSSDLLH